MAKLLSGSLIRRGGSGEFIDLAGAQPQLPSTPTTSTGFTLVTDEFLRTSYRSSLGNLEFNSGTVYSNLPDGIIRLFGTGTGFIHITSSTQSTSTTTGALVINGGVGIGGSLWVSKDINVNGLTIGQGFQGTNNIVVRGVAVDNVNEFPEGRASISIGWDNLGGLSTSLKTISIGRLTLSTGTKIVNTIAIGDSSLEKLGTIDKITIGSITAASLTSPVVITVDNHNITTGTEILIQGVIGMTELNNVQLWVNSLSSSTLALYTNNILSTPLTGINSYISSGTVYRVLKRSDNIAIGTDSGPELIDGVRNFLFGHKVAPNLTTGSNNFIIGHEVASNIITGNNIIAIGGDNLVDGQDDQVNIGSVFYYNGTGYSQFNSDVGLGLGSESTSTNTGALTVLGGIGLTGNLTVGKSALINSSISSTSTNTGALVVNGGLGIGENLNVGKEINVLGDSTATISPSGVGDIILQTRGSGDVIVSAIGGGNVYMSPIAGDVRIEPTLGGSIYINASTSGEINNMKIGNIPGGEESAVFTTANITSSATSTSTTTGALIVNGGVGIKGDVYSKTGISEENWLLYTPRVFVTAGVLPDSPRLGDFWIDSTIPAYLQYIRDGTDTFWIQIGAI